MPEEQALQTGDLPAAEVTGNVVPGAADPTGEPAAGDTNAQVEAFKAKAADEVAKRQLLEQQVELMKNQALVAQNTQPQGPQDVFAQAGLENYESPTVEQIRQQTTQTTQQMLTALQLQNFMTSNADFSEIVGTPGAGAAEPLKDFMNDNPNFRGLDLVVAKNPGMASVAYRLVKQHKELKDLRAQTSSQAEHQAQIDAANKLSPGSLSEAGGSHITQSDIDSDEKFEAMEARVQDGEFG